MEKEIGKKPLIELKKLQKVYSHKGFSVKALDDINLKIFKGEVLGIIGRSGSGKTTLLNLIGLLDKPTSGEIKFDGEVVDNISNRGLAVLRREKLGFVFQTFNLLPSLTVFENVEAALIHSQLSEEQIENKIASLLDDLHLDDMADRLPLELSVGQRQKVAMARAIVKDPALIIADEPIGEMDPIAGAEILDKLIALNKKSKITLIIASHGTSLLLKADRIIFIKDGKLVSQKESGY